MDTTIGYCGYSYHTHRYYTQSKSGFPTYLFRLQTEGTCEITANGRKIEITKGDLLLIKPGDTYELFVDKDNKSGDYHLVCEGDWITEWWNRSKKPIVTKISLDDKLLSLWRYLIVEVRRPESEKNHELSNYLLRALCLSLERAINETAPSFNRPFPVTMMMRYIEEYATHSIKIEDVAQHCGLSVSRAAHLFKNSTGKTIIEYAIEIRLSAAIERMKYTSMTLEQIAEDCGFGNYSYFHRVFQKKYGISPGAFRRME